LARNTNRAAVGLVEKILKFAQAKRGLLPAKQTSRREASIRQMLICVRGVFLQRGLDRGLSAVVHARYQYGPCHGRMLFVAVIVRGFAACSSAILSNSNNPYLRSKGSELPLDRTQDPSFRDLEKAALSYATRQALSRPTISLLSKRRSP